MRESERRREIRNYSEISFLDMIPMDNTHKHFWNVSDIPPNQSTFTVIYFSIPSFLQFVVEIMTPIIINRKFLINNLTKIPNSF